MVAVLVVKVSVEGYEICVIQTFIIFFFGVVVFSILGNEFF